MEAQAEAQLQQQATVPSAVVGTFVLLFNGLARINWSWWLSWPVWLVAIPLRLAWVPIALVLQIVLTLLAPVLLIFVYAGKFAAAVAAFVSSLEPLYTYFGTAATFGLVAGIFVALASSTLTNQLGMQSSSTAVVATRRNRKPWRITGALPYKQIQQQQQPQKAYLLHDPGYTHDDAVSSPNEGEWPWIETSSLKWRPGGLLSQTIHEEDGSSGTDL